ncbi:hypothetical protein Ssi03_13220 [Sphaerisporangium siamense]|uniref:Lsr2 DNA-binding domain-containing protein n=1 Tax=Sphaerisporangium siamense TaxID=795645 RepID=A0A7W7GBJ9_9ACTN|nr:Lsr2 family protein [Sphaerisporangium siamense]MBB4702910.1 hypothetical protein [Sphaerisporangium siamense]GII83332.1 hypothetical protein Ssi03_13220 [Sphaerisporangium siamense]
MATRTITVCDWHKGGKVEAVHHNTWTNLRGEPKQNDLCDEHQQEFVRAWDCIEQGSSSLATVSGSSRRAGNSRKANPARTSGPSESALIRAWARSVGEEVSEHGRVSFTVERKWKQAGRPNVLANSQVTDQGKRGRL